MVAPTTGDKQGCHLLEIYLKVPCRPEADALLTGCQTCIMARRDTKRRSHLESEEGGVKAGAERQYLCA